MSNVRLVASVLAGACPLLLGVAAATAQQVETLTMKQAVALALENSRELAVARAQAATADGEAGVERSGFRPNLFTGSGAEYTHGFPQTPGGAPPSIFDLAYTQTVFNGPASGRLHAAERQAEGRRQQIRRVRDTVILQTVAAYLELGTVRGALAAEREAEESTRRIADLTRARVAEGRELPVEISRAELAGARVEQRIAGLEGREALLEDRLRTLTGRVPGRPLALSPGTLPLPPAQPVGELVRRALANSPDLQAAEQERQAREERLKGERGGYWPSIDLVGNYAVFARFNQFDQFFRRFQRNNVNVGFEAKIPLFSDQTRAAVALAASELAQAEIELQEKRDELEAEVRREAQHARELAAAREVARLQHQVAQQDLQVRQARFAEGQANLGEVERARIGEHDAWTAFLQADYAHQQAELELLSTTGQLGRMFP